MKNIDEIEAGDYPLQTYFLTISEFWLELVLNKYFLAVSVYGPLSPPLVQASEF